MIPTIGRLAAPLAALMLAAAAPGALACSNNLRAGAGDTAPSCAANSYSDAGEQTSLKVELENVQITSYQLGVLDTNNPGAVATEKLVIVHEGMEIR
jgi:hypothetical protein